MYPKLKLVLGIMYKQYQMKYGGLYYSIGTSTYRSTLKWYRTVLGVVHLLYLYGTRTSLKH